MRQRWWDNIKGPLALLVVSVLYLVLTGGLTDPALM